MIIMQMKHSLVGKLHPAMLCRKETLSHLTRYQCVSCRKSFSLPWQLKRHRMLLCRANGCYGNKNLLLEGSSCGRSECEFHARGKPCRISCFIQVKKVCHFHQFLIYNIKQHFSTDIVDRERNYGQLLEFLSNRKPPLKIGFQQLFQAF